MKKLKFIKLLLILIGLSASNSQAFLTQEDIEGAQALVKSSMKLEDFIPSPNEKKHWLTIEEFNFDYKGKSKKFWMTNSYNTQSRWGKIIICNNPIDANDKNQNLYLTHPTHFSDFDGQSILSSLQYEYIPGERPHFILEHVTAGYKSGGQGYSQASVKYFLNEFVSKKTSVTHVFSDCRASATQHYFPKYGFQAGALEGYKFARPLAVPYYWVKEGTVVENVIAQPQKKAPINFVKRLASRTASSTSSTSSAHFQKQVGGEEPHPVSQNSSHTDNLDQVELNPLSLKEKGDQ